MVISLYIDHLKILDQNLITFFSQIGKTFIAAAVIALLLRVPTLLEDVNNSAVRLLKSNEFLKRLSIRELGNLRGSATEHAYLQSADSVNESLKKLDEKIANLFLEPYFEFYHMNVRCRMLEGNKIEKLISTHFSLKNPKMESCNGASYYKSRVIQNKIDNIDDSGLRKIDSFQVLKDNEKEFNDLREKYKLEFDDYQEESLTYNRVSEIKSKENASILFNEGLQLKMVETRTVTADDNVFVNRINYPTEDFSINYSFDDCDVDLLGNGFGTFRNTKDGGINVFKDGNSIHISSKGWLLPGNGIIIVHNHPNGRD